jgi:23S rRNA (guanine2445-N2)-methyltransferase / 23S rRNA (guanine2069-N7)-methyltransferase
LNGLSGANHRLVQADCLTWLTRETRRYDLIFLDPPTFSNSKSMTGTFDVQRDHVELLRAVSRLLSSEGILIFSNNNQRFRLDTASLPELVIEDISPRTIPPDFARHPRIHNCWKIVGKIG